MAEDLITAVQSGDKELVCLLLTNIDDDHKLNTALSWSARLGLCEICEVLLLAGADINVRLWGGFSPLLWATIFSDNPEMICLLLSKGSDVNCASYRRHQTVLHAAVIRGHVQFASILLQHGANPDYQDYLTRSPLHYAVQRNHLDCIKLLIRNNCNVNLCGVVNGEYVSPLYQALLAENLEAAKMLLLAGGTFNQPSLYSTLTYRHFYKTVERDLQMQIRPVFLQQQCRVCIRQQFKYDILQKLEELIYPKHLKDFILLEELNQCSRL